MHRIICFVLLLILVAAAVPAQQNPFLSGGGETGSSADSSSGKGSRSESLPAEAGPQNNSDVPSDSSGDQGFSARDPAPIAKRKQNRLTRWIFEIQRTIYEALAETMQLVKTEKEKPGMLLLVLAGAFLYGIIHALGPGHRKTILFSYFIAEEAPLIRGMAAGALMGILHGAAAAGIILPLFYLLRGSLLLTFNQVSRSIELAAFLFITLFGAVMLLYSIVHMLSDRSSNADRDTEVSQPSRSGSKTLLLIVGSSIIPCPGAAMILLFALSLEMIGTGLLAVASMSAGMAFTLSLVALVTLKTRATLRRIGDRQGSRAEFIHHILELAGYLMITLFGVIMTVGLI